MKIDIYGDINEVGFDDCGRLSPESLIYQSRSFLSFLEKTTDSCAKMIAAREGGEIVGYIAWCEKKDEHYGTVINSLPWYGSYGGCRIADSAHEEVCNALIDAYGEYVRGVQDLLSATTILSPLHPDHLEKYKAIFPDCVLDNRICQISQLPNSCGRIDEALLSTMTQKTRNLVRKSLKQAFSVRESDNDADWEFLVNVHHENMAIIGGKPKPVEHFQYIRELLPKNHYKLYIAMLDDVPVAALLNFYYGKTVEYITPVIRHEYRTLQPLSFLIYHGMLDAARTGHLFWNWGGTWRTQQSLYHFKAGWGAIDKSYTYVTYMKDESVTLLKNDTQRIVAAYQWFYLFPFQLLEE